MDKDSNVLVASIFRKLNPEIRKGKDPSLIEKRNIIASVFIAMLIGLAYSEMFTPVRESVRVFGITAGTLFLAFIFFFTSMRFFIGNQLHLLSKNVVELRGDIWLYDFLMITLQTIILCFLGGLCAVPINKVVLVDYVDLLVALYALDVIWIFSQWLVGLVIKSWKRKTIPWAWAAMNSILIGLIIFLDHLFTDIYSVFGLTLLLVVNVAAFILDIILIDHYDVI